MVIMFQLFWIAVLTYGSALLCASVKAKIGKTLIILLFFPVILYLILTIIFQIFFGLSIVDLYRIGCGMDAAHYTECYPEGYFMESK